MRKFNEGNDGRNPDGDRNMRAEARALADKGCNLVGKDDRESQSRGVECLKKAIKMCDDAAANFYLARCYFYGRGVIQSYDVAFDMFYHGAADLDDASAQYWLHVCYENGYGVNASQRESDDWLKIAAAHNLPAAQYELGKQRMRSRESVAVNDGIELVCFAAAAGIEEAQKFVSMLDERGGIDFLSTATGERVFDPFTDEQKNTLAKGLLRIGAAYKFGECVERDEEKAVYWLEKSVAAGSPEGQHLLAVICSDVKSSVYSPSRAAELMMRSAESGYAAGECGMGIFYQNGVGVEQSDDKAFEWYTKAAADGDCDAKRYLNERFH